MKIAKDSKRNFFKVQNRMTSRTLFTPMVIIQMGVACINLNGSIGTNCTAVNGGTKVELYSLKQH